jgi:hypothetical protein
MRISCRKRWLLQRTSRRLRRSDPHLAAMLAIFARLYVGEVIVSREQAASQAARRWRRPIRLAIMVACTAAGVTARTGRAVRQAVRTWATIRRRIGSLTQTFLASSPVTHPPAR